MLLDYELPGPDYAASIWIFDVDGRPIRHWINNMTLGTEGFLTWDGLDEKSQRAAVGIYVLAIECFNPSGKKIRQKISVVLATRF